MFYYENRTLQFTEDNNKKTNKDDKDAQKSKSRTNKLDYRVDMLKILCLLSKKSMFRKLYEYYDYMIQKVVKKSAFFMFKYGLFNDYRNYTKTITGIIIQSIMKYKKL